MKNIIIVPLIGFLIIFGMFSCMFISFEYGKNYAYNEAIEMGCLKMVTEHYDNDDFSKIRRRRVWQSYEFGYKNGVIDTERK